jgi:hypothetical protein
LNEAILDEVLKRCIVDLLRLERSDVSGKQLDMPLDHIDAALAPRLRDVARGAVGEGRARVCFARNLAFDPGHLDA